MTQKPRNDFWLSLSNIVFPDGNKENGGIRNAKPVSNTVVFNLFQAAEHAWSLLSKPKMQTFFFRAITFSRHRKSAPTFDPYPCRPPRRVSLQRDGVPHSETLQPRDPFSKCDCKRRQVSTSEVHSRQKKMTHCKKHPVFFYLKKIKSFF